MLHDLRILMVQPTGLSGIWHYANALAASLRREGGEVLLATQEPFEDLGSLNAAPVATFGVRTVTGSGWGRMPRPVDRARRHIAKLAALLGLMKTFRPHIVHFHAALGTLDFAYYTVFKRMGLSVVMTAHDAQPLHANIRWSDWARYRSADHIWVHSESSLAYLRRGGLEENTVSRIHHGNYLHLCQNAELSRSEARGRLGISQDSRVVLFFGAISRYKGLEVLLEAFSRIAAVMPAAQLLIVGEPLHPFDAYAEHIQRLRLTDKVTVSLGYAPVEDFAQYFRSANVVVLPYLRISQSGILHLAYGFGRALVVTSVGALGDTVREDGTGVVVKPNDPAAMAAGIADLLADSTRADVMGVRARHCAETKYSWEHIAKATGAVYKSLANRKARREGAELAVNTPAAGPPSEA